MQGTWTSAFERTIGRVLQLLTHEGWLVRDMVVTVLIICYLKRVMLCFGAKEAEALSATTLNTLTLIKMDETVSGRRLESD